MTKTGRPIRVDLAGIQAQRKRYGQATGPSVRPVVTPLFERAEVSPPCMRAMARTLPLARILRDGPFVAGRDGCNLRGCVSHASLDLSTPPARCIAALGSESSWRCTCTNELPVRRCRLGQRGSSARLLSIEKPATRRGGPSGPRCPFRRSAAGASQFDARGQAMGGNRRVTRCHVVARAPGSDG